MSSQRPREIFDLNRIKVPGTLVIWKMHYETVSRPLKGVRFHLLGALSSNVFFFFFQFTPFIYTHAPLCKRFQEGCFMPRSVFSNKKRRCEDHFQFVLLLQSEMTRAFCLVNMLSNFLLDEKTNKQNKQTKSDSFLNSFQSDIELRLNFLVQCPQN